MNPINTYFVGVFVLHPLLSPSRGGRMWDLSLQNECKIDKMSFVSSNLMEEANANTEALNTDT